LALIVDALGGLGAGLLAGGASVETGFIFFSQLLALFAGQWKRIVGLVPLAKGDSVDEDDRALKRKKIQFICDL
jgi:hypothetical protein